MTVYGKCKIALQVYYIRKWLLNIATTAKSRIVRKLAWAGVDGVTAAYNFMRWTWAAQ